MHGLRIVFLFLCLQMTQGCFRPRPNIDNDNDEPECPCIISRAQWGARTAKGTTRMTSTPTYVVIHHGGVGSRCFKPEQCKEIVRNYQKYHMDTNEWDDIGYNFIVGEDGNVYEGRGWGLVGAHAPGFNSKSLGICVIGDFSKSVPNQAAQNAVKDLISCSVARKKLSSSYRLRGHRDVKTTACPGTSFYNVIRTWKNY
ncbi:peptidoglycan-recognition protein SC2-like isoform X1 [Ruditapes philippinarum]|uniref:peptidoglycan-recognition protein SC2-like isoform X1 n=1 Tax=Ruditapes philippinarum TaxID=129788 RepID=UPI00295B3977|nr:peptidoglycan-recognition protein SC2-like isoform X1 [Ruditapes philippinarum]